MYYENDAMWWGLFTSTFSTYKKKTRVNVLLKEDINPWSAPGWQGWVNHRADKPTGIKEKSTIIGLTRKVS